MKVPARILRLLLCLLIAGPMSASAHAVARPETRVGEFFQASPKSASADLDQTLDARRESRSCDYDFASGVCKYLYAHANPVNMTDPSGESALGNVGIAITVISALASSYEFAKSPGLLTAGALGLDLAQVGKLKYVARGLFAIKNAISVRYIAAAFPGGINALRRYQLAVRTTTVGTHRHLAKELAEKGLSQTHQANHLNQAKAFTKIPEGQGLAVPLAGHATEAGPQHNRFHQVMEQFWDRYRSSTLTPDADDYKDAVEQALKAADIDAADAMHLAEAAVEQAKHFKYFTPGGPAIEIPGRFLPRTP